MSGATPTRTTSRPVAAFDFDGTLLDGDCLLILHGLVRSPLGRVMDGLRLLPALMLWKSGLRSSSNTCCNTPSLMRSGSGCGRKPWPAWSGIANRGTGW